jgi:hypothetical protein
MEDVDALLLEARRRYEVQRWADNTLAPTQLPAWDELGAERRAALRAIVAGEQVDATTREQEQEEETP